jgi:hypothetical protein
MGAPVIFATVTQAPNRWWRLAALKNQRKIPRVTFISHHSRARGADDGGRWRRDASYGVARDSTPVSTTAAPDDQR